MEKSTLLNRDFWDALYQNAIIWITSSLPSILFTIFIFLILLKLFSMSTGKLKKVIIKVSAKRQVIIDAEDEKRANTLISIVRQAGKILIWTIFVMTLLNKFSIDIGPILASAGIVGLAVGFGAQELVRDFIAGFFLLLENQVRTGDVAIINGTGGLVEKIQLRTITLRDLSGVVHIFQNGKINSLSNLTKEWSAMVFDVGVAYREDTDKVIEVMKRVGDELMQDEAFKDNFIEPIEVMGVDAFADSSVVVRARIKTKPGTQWPTGRKYRALLKKAFDAEGISIPFPHRTLFLGDENTEKLRAMVDK